MGCGFHGNRLQDQTPSKAACVSPNLAGYDKTNINYYMKPSVSLLSVLEHGEHSRRFETLPFNGLI
jgi:hypothetical protein